MPTIQEIKNHQRLIADYLEGTSALIPPASKGSIKALITETAAIHMLSIPDSSVSGSWLEARVPSFGTLSDGSKMYPEWAVELLCRFVHLADLHRQPVTTPPPIES